MREIVPRIRRFLSRQLYMSMQDYVRRRDLTSFVNPHQPLPRGVAIVPFSVDHLEALDASFPHHIVADFEPRSQMSQGFVAMADQKAVGYIWATLLPREREGEAPFLYPIRPGQGQSYLYDLQVLPETRGSGLGLALMVNGMLWAKSMGSHSMLFTTALDNQAVHRLTEKLGFNDVGLISFKRVLRFSTRDLSALNFATGQGASI